MYVLNVMDFGCIFLSASYHSNTLVKQVISSFALIVFVCEFFFFNAEVTQSVQCFIASSITFQMPTEIYKKLFLRVREKH